MFTVATFHNPQPQKEVVRMNYRDQVIAHISEGAAVSAAVRQLGGYYFVQGNGVGYRFPDGSELILFDPQSPEFVGIHQIPTITEYLQKAQIIAEEIQSHVKEAQR